MAYIGKKQFSEWLKTEYNVVNYLNEYNRNTTVTDQINYGYHRAIDLCYFDFLIKHKPVNEFKFWLIEKINEYNNIPEKLNMDIGFLDGLKTVKSKLDNTVKEITWKNFLSVIFSK
jgi:hypothetical protein